jgi:hypothetical protein
MLKVGGRAAPHPHWSGWFFHHDGMSPEIGNRHSVCTYSVGQSPAFFHLCYFVSQLARKTPWDLHTVCLFLFWYFIVHTFIASHSYSTFIRHSSSLVSSVGKPSSADNRIRDFHTASRRTMYWATPHPTELRRTLWTTPHPNWPTPHPSELQNGTLSLGS